MEAAQFEKDALSATLRMTILVSEEGFTGSMSVSGRQLSLRQQ